MKKTRYTATYRKGRIVVRSDYAIHEDGPVPAHKRRNWFRQLRRVYPGITILK